MTDKKPTSIMNAVLPAAVAQLTAVARAAQTKADRVAVYRLTDAIAQAFIAAVEKEFAAESKPKRRKSAKVRA
jgi:hypothetical protein